MKKQPTASITEALLVRKGAALPSRLAEYGEHHGPSAVNYGAPHHLRPLAQDPSAANTKPAESCAAPAATADHSGGHGGERARVTLRLDNDRHFRLKLAAAHLDRSLQDIMISALDEFLARTTPNIHHGDCVCLAAHNAAKAS